MPEVRISFSLKPSTRRREASAVLKAAAYLVVSPLVFKSFIIGSKNPRTLERDFFKPLRAVLKSP